MNSIFSSILYLSMICFCICCTKQIEPTTINTTNEVIPIENKSYRYLALGDSYTIGQGVSSDEKFPALLVDSLTENNFIAEELEVLATTGWTTTNLLNALQNENYAEYDLVTLLIGVNNQYQGKPFSTFESEFTLLLAQSVTYAGDDANNVVVISIPDYSVTPFGQNQNPETIVAELEMYNSRKKEITESMGIKFVDITPISKQAKDDSSLLANDNLHPSGKMYALWVAEMLDAIIEALEE